MKTSSVFVFSGRLCRPFLLKKSGILRADEGSSGIVFTGGRSVEQAQQVWPHLRIFALGNPLPLNTKLLVGILPNPYAERTVPPYGKSKTPHHPALPGNSGRTQPNRAEDGPAPDKADRHLPAEDGDRRVYHLCRHQGH